MMLFTTHNNAHFEEEEEEDEMGIDDALLGELEDDLAEDDLLGEELAPLIKEVDPFLIPSDDEDSLKEDDGKLYGEDEEEEEDADYDSFDDRDEF